MNNSNELKYLEEHVLQPRMNTPSAFDSSPHAHISYKRTHLRFVAPPLRRAPQTTLRSG